MPKIKNKKKSSNVLKFSLTETLRPFIKDTLKKMKVHGIEGTLKRFRKKL